MRSLEAALLSLTLGLSVTPALAGPCLKCDPGTGPFALGWWHDRALSPAGRLAQSPRIDVGDPGVGDPIAVVWEDRTGGDGDIVLASSGDGGCSWTIRPLTSGTADDRLPDVAMVSSLGAVTVAFLRNGVPWVTASADGGRTFAPAERLHPTASGDPASPPRIAAVALNGAAHIHAVWGEAGTLRYARSTSGGAPGSWQSAAAPLSAGFTGYTRWAAPDVATDTRSTDASLLSAVTIAAAGVGPGRSVSEIFVVRSNDSGASFYGDPVLPATRDQRPLTHL